MASTKKMKKQKKLHQHLAIAFRLAVRGSAIYLLFARLLMLNLTPQQQRICFDAALYTEIQSS